MKPGRLSEELIVEILDDEMAATPDDIALLAREVLDLRRELIVLRTDQASIDRLAASLAEPETLSVERIEAALTSLFRDYGTHESLTTAEIATSLCEMLKAGTP